MDNLEIFRQGIVKKGKFTFGRLQVRYWNADLGWPMPLQTTNWNALTYYGGRPGMETPEDLR